MIFSRSLYVKLTSGCIRIFHFGSKKSTGLWQNKALEHTTDGRNAQNTNIKDTFKHKEHLIQPPYLKCELSVEIACLLFIIIIIY